VWEKKKAMGGLVVWTQLEMGKVGRAAQQPMNMPCTVAFS
jgi:hypothetical protein